MFHNKIESNFFERLNNTLCPIFLMKMCTKYAYNTKLFRLVRLNGNSFSCSARSSSTSLSLRAEQRLALALLKFVCDTGGTPIPDNTLAPAIKSVCDYTKNKLNECCRRLALSALFINTLRTHFALVEYMHGALRIFDSSANVLMREHRNKREEWCKCINK